MSTIDISTMPLTVWLVGNGKDPALYTVMDREAAPNGIRSFIGMTLVERAALRALCEEAIRMIDASGTEVQP